LRRYTVVFVRRGAITVGDMAGSKPVEQQGVALMHLVGCPEIYIPDRLDLCGLFS
jgi:hypothetical protein